MSLSPSDAKRFGSVGGKETARARNREAHHEWARRAQRQSAASVLHDGYPDFVPIWCRNAALIRWGRSSEVQPVPLVMTTSAIALRERRALERRRRDYELARVNGTLPAPSKRSPSFLEA